MHLGIRAFLPLLLLAVLLPALPTARAQAAPAHASLIDQYRVWIHEARLAYPYPQSENKMYRVMMCESGGDRFAIGAGRWYGLFQYVPSTWRGSWNPYRAADIHDAHAQIFGTAAAWHRGMQSAWSCYYITR